MKIAQLAPLWESVPPVAYGGTELVVYNLTERLVAKGHDVTLFASGDSSTSAKLVATVPRALYRAGVPWTNYFHSLLQVAELLDRLSEFDILHAHLNTDSDYATMALAHYLDLPMVFTIHMELPITPDRADEAALLARFWQLPYITISNAQRTIPDLNYLATVYNGIDLDNFRFNDRPGEYLAWLGRFCEEKGAREAIQVARRTGRKLVMAGKVDQQNQPSLDYFERYIKPELDGEQIVYLGEVDQATKVDLLAGARALLNPLRWNEPFGLVTVEALACGTPVIAFDIGPLRELVVDQQQGFIVNTLEEMTEAVGRVGAVNRYACRRRVEERFSAQAMADGYEQAYLKELSLRQEDARWGRYSMPRHFVPAEPPLVSAGEGYHLARIPSTRRPRPFEVPRIPMDPDGAFSPIPDLADETSSRETD